MSCVAKSLSWVQGKSWRLPAAFIVAVYRKAGLFSLARPAAPPAATAAWGPVRQPLPGQVLLPEAGLRAVATLVQPPLPALEAGMLLLPAAWQDLYWRSRRPGDRMLLPGRAGRQKVKDLLINEKIPVAQRDAVPLLCRQRPGSLGAGATP